MSSHSTDGQRLSYGHPCVGPTRMATSVIHAPCFCLGPARPLPLHSCPASGPLPHPAPVCPPARHPSMAPHRLQEKGHIPQPGVQRPESAALLTPPPLLPGLLSCPPAWPWGLFCCSLPAPEPLITLCFPARVPGPGGQKPGSTNLTFCFLGHSDWFWMGT